MVHLSVTLLHLYIQCIPFYYSWHQYCRNFFHFHNLKLQFISIFCRSFFSIFCRYLRYLVGTNDILVSLRVPTKLRKSIMGQFPIAPAPRPALTRAVFISVGKMSLCHFFLLLSTMIVNSLSKPTTHSGPECNQSAPKVIFPNFWILIVFANTLYAFFSSEIDYKYGNFHLKIEIWFNFLSKIGLWTLGVNSW